ncbi:MAG TPA: heavy metal-associated domain-containing protein, partial [Hyphomicrobiales bacterium]|nr:heavy metal-associated domain-containing protein [Hyphomicrobiales bacterium]
MSSAASLAYPETIADGPAARENTCHLITLAVPDMTCGGCLRKVEAALAAVPGVMSARANLSERR